MGTLKVRLRVLIGLLLFVCAAQAINSTFSMDWESGFPDGSPLLDPAQEPSFSINTESSVNGCTNSGNEITDCKCGVNGYSPRNCDTYYGNSSLHSHTVQTGLSWARKGSGVLKYYADGRELGTGDSVPSGRYASYRCELGSIPYHYDDGDHVYYTASFYLPSGYWDQTTLYSIIITQWKITDDPHGALRISNKGDYKVYYAGGSGLFDSKYTGSEGVELGTAKKNAWTDVKIYYKKSLSSDGVIRIYLNGIKVFEHFGVNMLGRRSDNSGGYVKFGMYTEIRDERVIYFDAVSMSSRSNALASEAAWVAEHLHLPSVTLTSPSNLSAISGVVSLTADATDPGGSKLGTAGNIVKVEWFTGSECMVADAVSAPYTATWSPEDGSYEIFARATDADGNVATSSKVTVYVGNRPPTATITSPVASAVLAVGSPTTVTIAAGDPDGSVSKVELFAKQGAAAAARVSVDTAAPFEMSWTPSANGAYLLYAIATDTVGKTGTSVYVGVTAGATTSDVTLAASDDAAMKGRTSDRDTTNNYGGVEMYMRARPDRWRAEHRQHFQVRRV